MLTHSRMFFVVFISCVHLVQANDGFPYVSNSLNDVFNSHHGDFAVRCTSTNNFGQNDSKTIDICFLGKPDHLIKIGGTTAGELRSCP